MQGFWRITQLMILFKNLSKNISRYYLMAMKIASNDMIFIWRKYILSLGIPNVIFYGSLHAILRAKLIYDSVADTYCITSIFLPQISNFSRFWENTIKEADDSEIELDEIPGLFAYWNRQNKNPIDNAFSLQKFS